MERRDRATAGSDDPTSPSLARVKQPWSEAPRHSVGLVFAGGGFKGAYQVGAWKALHEAGFQSFDVVAGTSAGALNAVLAASGQLELAERLWTEGSFVKLAPRSTLRYLCALGVLIAPTLLSFSWLGLLSIYGLLTLGRPASSLPAWPAGLAFLLLTISAVTGTILAAQARRRRLFFLIDVDSMFRFSAGAFVSVFMGAMLAHGAVIDFAILSGLLAAGWESAGPAMLGGCIVGLVFTLLGLWLLRSAQSTVQLLSNEQITAALFRSLETSDLSSQLYVTTALGSVLLDPFRSNPPVHGDLYDISSSEPALSTRWVPLYNAIDRQRSREEVVRILSLSSALPLVYRAGKSEAGHVITDGGLADNVPALPVLESAVEHVIVIGLEPLERDPSRWLASHVQSVIEARWLATQPTADLVTLHRTWLRQNGPAEQRTLREGAVPPLPEISSERVLVLSPSKDLAAVPIGFLKLLTGTLDFRLPTRRRWLEQGYRETRERLRELGLAV